ncbi:flagellar biosynthesis protein FlhB [Tabrizicola sp. WMC-M-20]|nr:flagellar biosynthesis protein FlhB [Tabrizicola sp. WMC-M-20]
MSGQEDDVSRSEEPTDKKLADARKKGDVPSSRETGNLTAVFSLFVVMVFLAPFLAPGLSDHMARLIEAAPALVVGTGQTGVADLGWIIREFTLSLALVLAPMFLLMLIAAISGVLIQGETVVAGERIKPDFKKISPLAGLKKIYSGHALIEFLKNMAKVLAVGAIAGWVSWQAVTAMLPGAVMIPEAMPGFLRQGAVLMLIGVTCLLVPVALADILWKRAQWLRKHKMSLKQVRDERKDAEGDPQIRMRRAEIRRRRSRQQIAVAVPKASLILTNPTHFAVALRYERGVDAAPVCVAKGMDLVAGQIRRIARENGIPIIENRELARALHASVEVDGVIPAEHWQAVAEIVGYVMDLRRRIQRQAPGGSALRLGD